MDKSRGRASDHQPEVYSTDASQHSETPSEATQGGGDRPYFGQTLGGSGKQAEGSAEPVGHSDSEGTRNTDGTGGKEGKARSGRKRGRNGSKGKRKPAADADAATPSPEANGIPPADPTNTSPVVVLPATPREDKAEGNNGSDGKPSPGPRARKRLGQDETADGEEPELEGFRASDLDEEDVEWFWKDRLPMNTVAFLQADKDKGKSTWARAIAACMTGGPLLPGMEGDPRFWGDVLWFAGEEALKSRVRPGLRVAGANLDHCHLYSLLAPDGRALELPRGLDRLRKLICRFRAKMVLIDPIFMASDGSLNLEGPTVEARAFMRKMLAFAAEEKILFLWTRNLTKNRSNGALNAGRGSAELGNAARAVLHLGEFADTPGIYGLAVAACNDGKKVPTLVYSVETVDRHGRIAHRGERDVTADDLLAGADALLDRTLLDRAKRIIRQMIPSGWVDSKIIKQKGEAAMASTRTMQQAHLALKCTEKQEGSRESTVVYWGPPIGGWK